MTTVREEQQQERADQVERAVKGEREKFDDVTALETDPERTLEHRTPGFRRIRTKWSGEDGQIVRHVLQLVESELVRDFADAYQLMNRLLEIVREPEHVNGEIKTDLHGFTIWKRDEFGDFVEDWTKLGIKQRELFLFQLTTRLVAWEQQAADSWGEAMLSKATWEERFAKCFDDPPGRLTVEDRTQKGRLGSMDERYFAITRSLYSRKAEALVRSMERLCQRLKDVMGV